MRRSVPIFVFLPPFPDSSVPLSPGWGHFSHFLPSLSFLSRARAYTLILCANCLHSFTIGGEGLKIRGIGVKAKVKGNREDMELKSKGRKGNQVVARCFSVSGEGSEGKKWGL